MQFKAKARFIHFSPYKLRPMADVIRGKNVRYAIDWLTTYAVKKAVPMRKVVESAAASAKHLNNVEASALVIKDIRVDQGPMLKYFRPGAMGRANVIRKRYSHVSVVIESLDHQEEKKD